MNSPMARAFVVVSILALSTGCAVVKSAQVSDDWEKVDRNRVKRLVVVTQPDPAGDPQVGEMWSALAARRIDLKRSFIIMDKLHQPAEQPVDPKALCTEGIEGVLWLKPEVQRQGGGVEAQLEGHLFRCGDLAEVWKATAGGSWDTKDDQLTQTIADYTNEFGPSVEPYVVASYRILHATLDTLPDPVLTEADKDDKIEYAQ